MNSETEKPAENSAESPLAHKQKLDCALQLARSMALDFNNALTSILGHASWILSQIPTDHPLRGSLLEIEKSAARAAEIANDLGAFSRQDKEPRAQTAGNLNALLQRTVDVFRQNPDGAGIQWVLQFERKPFAARFDEARIQQAFIKILENSVEALKGCGQVSIQTRNVDVAESTQDRNVRLAPGAYVCAEISDNGCGIEPGVLPRIFEPFFTTKRGEHRGLGLAWVYGIVTNHGGGVAVSSQPGLGTSTRVYLPAEKRALNERPAAPQPVTGNETLLLVDDEELLLTLGQTVLSAFGYRVLTANSGRKALEILGRPDTSVDLVITDLIMPAMSGRELIEHIRKMAPNTRILCTSGYVWSGTQEHTSAYLQKPFTSQELVAKVQEVLGRGEPAPDSPQNLEF
jgi:two-component system, cell cycle sensor histidine kinase and response regulator CckA